VTEGTILAEQPLMGIVLGMTGITIGRSILENEIRMTAFTCDTGVLSEQREGGTTVVKR